MIESEVILPQKAQKWIFISSSFLSLFFLYLLSDRVTRPWWIREAFSPPSLGNEEDLDIPLIHQSHQDSDHHDHEEEINFVLRDSNLGAPEFIGRTDEDLGFVGWNSNLHLEISKNGISFNSMDYKENKIAIGLAVKGNEGEESLRDMPLFKSLLPSFCRTATRGFNYHFYVAHDHSDPFFHFNFSHFNFSNHFNKQIQEKCKVRVSLHLVECGHSGKPAWAQNDAMMAAYMDNMDYFYRLNDDTVMETSGWTEKFIDQLERFTPPKVGVVGPWFKEGNIAILTHDFVHRTHIEIFGNYYPRVFTDWFADDWITKIYWPERCRKVPGTKIRHTMERGQRYVTHFETLSRLQVEVDIAKGVLSKFISSQNNETEVEINKNFTSVVSLSLYGKKVSVVYGCLRYSLMLPVIFPGWRVRIYSHVNQSTAKAVPLVIKKLIQSGVEVILLKENDPLIRKDPLLWSYLVAEDENVERFLVRPCDTRPSEREKKVLELWKNETLYCIRDHLNHTSFPLIPGLVGGVNKKWKKIGPIRNHLLSSKSEYDFLNKIIWKKFSSNVYCHDSVSCHKWKNSFPFPLLRSGQEYIGMKVDFNDLPLPRDPWTPLINFSSSCVILKNTGFKKETVEKILHSRPLLWSQDFHIGPIMDLKSLLQPIGVRFEDKSLSYYCEKIKSCAENLKVINRDNGMVLNRKLIKKFYQAYKDDPLMKEVTSYVCSLPVAMCQLFKPFNKSIIIWASIRYEQWREEPRKWKRLNKMLQEVDQDPRSILATNNLYDAKYIQYFTGKKPLVIPNYCNYLKDFYNPSKQNFLLAPIHNSELSDLLTSRVDLLISQRNLDFSLLPLRDLYPQYLYSDLSSHPGIVYVPYQVSMISLTEQYRMNIPLFFPSLDLLTSWHLKYQVVRQMTWKSFSLKKSNGSIIPGYYDNLPDPNNEYDEGGVKFWLEFSDFYQWPHIIYYENFEDLVDKMENVDLEEISRRMEKENRKERKKIKKLWSQVLLNITSNM